MLPDSTFLVFAVEDIVVEGSTVFDRDDFEPLLEPYRGSEQTISALVALRRKLTDLAFVLFQPEV